MGQEWSPIISLIEQECLYVYRTNGWEESEQDSQVDRRASTEGEDTKKKIPVYGLETVSVS